MPSIRQMPGLMIRGSLANVTMKHLTPQQRQHVSHLVGYVANHPAMQKHKLRILQELSRTIGGDYADSRDAAVQEYLIAIWRGVVDLFYHRRYSFRCRACGQDSYRTKRGKLKPIDRVQIPCPNCRKVLLTDTGCLTHLRAGEYIDFDTLQAAYRDMPDGWRAPQFDSTIDYIAGEAKYPDPEAIIRDDNQLRKFFGEFVWNYFRQMIVENKPEGLYKESHAILGDTAWVITQELISLCDRMNVDYDWDGDRLEPKDGRYSIRINGLLTPPEFSIELGKIRANALNYNCPVITTNPTEIQVIVTPDALPLPVRQETSSSGKVIRQYQALVARPAKVTIITGSDEYGGNLTANIPSYQMRGGYMECDHEAVESAEALSVVRAALPDGHCKAIFDILTQQGEVYQRFSERFGGGEARISHIARFLGITPRAVKQHQATIRVVCMAHDLVPADY